MSDVKGFIIAGEKITAPLRVIKDLIVSQVITEIQSRVISKGKKNRIIKAVPVYVEGIMGMGKSQSIYQAAKLCSKFVKEVLGDPDGDFGVVEIRFAGKTASDIQGIPAAVKRVQVYPPEIAKNLTLEEKEELVLKWLKDELLPGISKTTTKYGFLFADEINQVEDPAVASLLYQLLLDGKMNDYTLPKNWFVVAAGNRESDGGIYNRLPAPIRDRLLILEAELKLDHWVEDYAIPYNVNPAVISFLTLSDNRKYFHTYCPTHEEEGDPAGVNYVFATPRSWVWVGEKLDAYESALINKQYTGFGKLITIEILTLSICGLVGKELGLKFMEYYKMIKSVNLDGIYSVEWNNGAPSSGIDNIVASPEQLLYLTYMTLQMPQTQGTAEQFTKILLYLNVKASSSGTAYTSIITNNLTEEMKEYINDYIAVWGCADISLQTGSKAKKIEELTSRG